MVNIEPVRTRRDIYYTNEHLTARDVMRAIPETVLTLGRYKSSEDKIVQVEITNITEQTYGAITTFICTDKSNLKVYLCSYDLRTKRFTFEPRS